MSTIIEPSYNILLIVIMIMIAFIIGVTLKILLLGFTVLYMDIHTQKRIKQAFQRYWDKYMKISKDMENQKGQENQEE